MVLHLPEFEVYKTSEFFESGHSFPRKNPRQISWSTPLRRVHLKEISRSGLFCHRVPPYPPSKNRVWPPCPSSTTTNWGTYCTYVVYDIFNSYPHLLRLNELRHKLHKFSTFSIITKILAKKKKLQQILNQNNSCNSCKIDKTH